MHGERTKQIEEEEKKPRIELLHSTGLAMEQMNCVPDLLPGRGNKVSAAWMHNETREEMSSLDHYFFLSDGKVIVNGSKKSVLLDLKNGKIYSVNSSAGRIINLGEQGYKIIEAIERLSTELGTYDVISFLKELSGLGMVQFSECRKQRKPDKVPLPKLDFLWIEVTSRCNLRCVHCYAEAGSNASKAKQHIELSLEEFKKVIDEAAGLNCQKLQLTGGEPTLRDDLRELVTYANASGFKIIEIL